MIDESEAKALGKALDELARVYALEFASEKVMAWVGVAVAAGSVYGPRVYRLATGPAKLEIVSNATPE